MREPGETRDGSPFTILIVDDSSTMRRIIHRTLSQAGLAGLEVLEAGDGHEALAQLRSHPEVQLVLSDVNMPDMDGLQLLQALEHEPCPAHPPVVMISAEGNEVRRGEAMDAGAAGYIDKPFTPESMLRALAPFLEKSDAE